MIKISQVDKKYKRNLAKISSYNSLRDLFTYNFWKTKKIKEDFYALKNINIDIKHGEKVGIIGPNGSGKSTLLKIISRVTPPTSGFLELNGRVASLLEVGTGFHPELTGKENIYLNGAILGMSRQEIQKSLDEIVEFSEIEAFINTPVKHYSSGMFVRLAFSVASHLTSDILILDEVLAVGDHRFQEKCFGKMKEITGSKKTVLFVSHNMGSIQSFCDRVILINKGHIEYDGNVSNGIQHYLNLNKTASNNRFILEKKTEDIPLEITRIWITPKESLDIVSEVTIESSFYLWYEFEVKKVVHNTVIALLLSREGMSLLYHYDSDSDPKKIGQREPGVYRDRVLINTDDFKDGNYEIALLVGYGQDNITNPDCRIQFKIINTQFDFSNKGCRYDRPGCLRKSLIWETVEYHKITNKKEVLA